MLIPETSHGEREDHLEKSIEQERRIQEPVETKPDKALDRTIEAHGLRHAAVEQARQEADPPEPGHSTDAPGERAMRCFYMYEPEFFTESAASARAGPAGGCVARRAR